MKIVIDTNIIASSIFFGGKPQELINLLLDEKIDAYVTKEIIEEYQATIEYLKNKYNGKKLNIPLAHIISSMKCIEASSNINICRDPDDNKFINCALQS